MKFSPTALFIMASATIVVTLVPPCWSYTVRYPQTMPPNRGVRSAEATSMMMSAEDTPDPTTFREAEVLGLRLMQEGNFEEALVAFQKGMKLPGTRPDVLRTKALSGPSPVGGAFGGTESQRVMGLDDFELQAAHYNMACAHARLGNLDDAIANLAKAFENGFDNYNTVRGDPDLDSIKQEADFTKLMEAYEGKTARFGGGASGVGGAGGAFNPFGFFGKK